MFWLVHWASNWEDVFRDPAQLVAFWRFTEASAKSAPKPKLTYVQNA